jgi:hypothetical protein
LLLLLLVVVVVVVVVVWFSSEFIADLHCWLSSCLTRSDRWLQ